MKKLIINRVVYTVETVAGKSYGADVKFSTGLNIIYGPNSVGKSSLITGIIYCLGGEKCLGVFQNKQNPFKPEFYDRINNEKITKSYVTLEVSNGSDTVILMRSIINKTDVVGLKKTTIENSGSVPQTRYLIASGDGVFSSEGLQAFLFKFLDWDIVDVPTYDAGYSKLYFENLLPLFFVEQRAGWSQIQARQVMRYSIREVKKVTFEYLMGLDRFDIHLTEIKRRAIQDRIQKLKRDLNDYEERILVPANGSVENGVLMIRRKDTGVLTIDNTIKTLREQYQEQIKDVEILSTVSEDADSQENSLRRKLRITAHRVRKAADKVNLLMQEIASYENYINRININKVKNRQLKKIEGIAPELNISTCPVCENPLPAHGEGECSLCHQDLKRKISTPDENLEFLEDEKASFEKILDAKRLELRKTRYQLQQHKETEKSLTETIDHQLSTYVGPQLAAYRHKVVQLDTLDKEIELLKRSKEKWSSLNSLRNQINELEKEDESLKIKVKEYEESKNDQTLLGSLVINFRNNVRQLRLLKGKDVLISTIKIDETDSYAPYLDEYDLYNISSSSDNVRILLSYYLALLQTAISSTNPKVKFPNLLILDEPKQQNLDNQDIITFIDLLEHLPKNSCQVILTTFSDQKKDKNLFKQFIRHEMFSEYDYLLKEIPSDSPQK